jgi:hypothetical protein
LWRMWKGARMLPILGMSNYRRWGDRVRRHAVFHACIRQSKGVSLPRKEKPQMRKHPRHDEEEAWRNERCLHYSCWSS